MATPVEQLQARIARFEHDLDDMRATLRALEPEAGRVGDKRGDYSTARPYGDDREALRETFAVLLRSMDVDPGTSAPTPEELQKLMLEGGVDPSGNLLSSGIIEMREE